MNKSIILSAIATLLAASAIPLHAQTTASTVQASTFTLTAANIYSLESLSDAQLKAVLKTLAATPLIWPNALSNSGNAVNYWSLAHPDWPPLPNSLGSPVWKLASPPGSDSYLMDDLDYPPPLPGDGETNSDDGGIIYDSQPLILTSNDLYLKITGWTNATAYLTIHLPWNVTNGVWGLYFKTNLAVPYNWRWLLRNAPGQTNLVATNLPAALGFFMLGPPTAIRPGFTNNSLGPNDDDYTGDGNTGDLLTNLLATIGFPINFFGTTYTNLYVNNNGNVTFDNFLSDYTPTNLLSLVTDPEAAVSGIIAPFWADVDTRSTNSGVTTYGTNTVDGRAAFGVSWIDVGYYPSNYDKLDSFQLVLINRSDRTNGDFDLEFNYAQIQWETGDATLSEGIDGQGGFSARAGYADAGGSTLELKGSATNGAFLDTNTVTGLIYTNRNSTMPGRYVFQFHNGTNSAIP